MQKNFLKASLKGFKEDGIFFLSKFMLWRLENMHLRICIPSFLSESLIMPLAKKTLYDVWKQKQRNVLSQYSLKNKDMFKQDASVDRSIR